MFKITKNSVMEIENLVVNHESRPVKSNPAASKSTSQFIVQSIESQR